MSVFDWFCGEQGFHPITFIDDECVARGWTRRDLAKHMGGDVYVNILVLDMYALRNVDCPLLDNKTADQLGTAFGMSKEFWLRLDNSWHDANRRTD